LRAKRRGFAFLDSDLAGRHKNRGAWRAVVAACRLAPPAV